MPRSCNKWASDSRLTATRAESAILNLVAATRFVTLALLAGLLTSCGNQTPANDTTLAARIPHDATILAGVHLDRLHQSPLFQQLPASAASILEPLREAATVL